MREKRERQSEAQQSTLMLSLILHELRQIRKLLESQSSDHKGAVEREAEASPPSPVNSWLKEMEGIEGL